MFKIITLLSTIIQRNKYDLDIVYTGLHDLGELIHLYLKQIHPHNVKFTFANSDDTTWFIEELNKSISETKCNLCFLFMNNLLGIKKEGLESYEELLSAFYSLIKDLTFSKNIKVVILTGLDDLVLAEKAIQAGARIVYCVPLKLNQFYSVLPAIMKWNKEEIIPKIIRK